MAGAQAALMAAERRGRALAQRHFGGPGEHWLLVARDDPDGHALLAAARQAGRFGAGIDLRLVPTDNPSALWQAASQSASILGAQTKGGPGENSLSIVRRDGREEPIATLPGADDAWAVPLVESGPWVREARPSDEPMSCARCREVDRRAIDDFHVPGICLMENAAVGATAVAVDMLADVRGATVFIAVGGGNNGGDGLAMARGLADLGATVAVGMFKPAEGLSGDAAVNMAVLRATGGVPVLPLHEDASGLADMLAGAGLVVDALLGTGFRGGLSPSFRAAIDAINAAGRPVLCLDLPSGMNGDTGVAGEAAVRADRTVTFAAVKTGLLTADGSPYCGKLYLADIGAPLACLV